MASSDKVADPVHGLVKGDRLTCGDCGSEIEIISPCTCDPPDMSLVCCGKPMSSTPGRDVNIGVE